VHLTFFIIRSALQPSIIGLLLAFLCGCKGKDISLEALTRQAEKGDIVAQRQLGSMYADGQTLGVERDEVKALTWLSMAANNNDPAAQDLLGKMYFRGSESIQNTNEAFHYFEKAAKNGVAHAQHMMGLRSLNGWGVDVNYPLAERWFEKAAKQGLPAAQFNLGLLYPKYHKRHPGINQTMKSSLTWINRAANQGHAPAQKWLAVVLSNGKILPPDYIEAYKWASLVGEDNLIVTLSSKMTPEQIAKAKVRAEGFHPKVESSGLVMLGWIAGVVIAIEYGLMSYFLIRRRRLLHRLQINT
jgi:hypothetical protein